MQRHRAQKKLAISLFRFSPVISYSRAAPITLGIWVFAWSPLRRSLSTAIGSNSPLWLNASARLQVIQIAGDAVKVGEHFVHAAVLGFGVPCICCSESRSTRNFTQSASFVGTSRACGLSAAAGVQQAGHDLVQRYHGAQTCRPTPPDL